MPEDKIPEAEPMTVELGQTSGEVKEILGNPKKVLKAGKKEIHVYEDLKITFIDGKVADMERARLKLQVRRNYCLTSNCRRTHHLN